MLPQLMFFIVSCQRYLETRVPIVRDTWLSQLKKYGFKYRIVIGNPDLSCDFVEKDKMLYVRCQDTWEGLSLKTFRILQYSQTLKNFDGIVKVDDDVLLNVDRFVSILPLILSQGFAGHYIFEIEDHFKPYQKTNGAKYEGGYYAGPCYFLGKKEVRLAYLRLCASKGHLSNLFEDKMVGDALRQLGFGAERLEYFRGYWLWNRDIDLKQMDVLFIETASRFEQEFLLSTYKMLLAA